MRRIVLFVLFVLTGLSISIRVSAEISGVSELEKLLPYQKNSTIKRHLKLAIDLANKNLSVAFKEEVEVLSQIDRESAEVYAVILNNGPGTVFGETFPHTSDNNVLPITPGSGQDVVVSEKFERAMAFYKDSKVPSAKLVLEEILELDKRNVTAQKFLDNIKDEEFKNDDSKPFQAIAGQLFEEAMKFYRKNMYAACVEKLDKASEIDPDNKQIKKYAVLSVEKNALIKDKEECEKLLNAGDRLRNELQVSKARKAYEKTLLINPSETRAMFYIQEFNKRALFLSASASSCYLAKKINEAWRDNNEALEYDPKNAQALELEKKLKMEMAVLKDEDKRKKEANRLYNKGVVYFGKGEFDLAIECWNSALEIDPNDEEAVKNIAIAKGRSAESSVSKGKKVEKTLAEAEELFNQGLIDMAKAKYNYVLRVDARNNTAAAGIKKIVDIEGRKDSEKITKR